ncbi:hypothetical protein RIF29_45992 [Crotalaria pallida]|uniref:Uncharacterized protein n=1 Tax=Crotalaria pallida TaxID=3830 RepID=A0AAN9DTW9_CROPI
MSSLKTKTFSSQRVCTSKREFDRCHGDKLRSDAFIVTKSSSASHWGEITELPFSLFHTRNIVAVVASLPLPPGIEIKSELKPRLREIFKRGNSTIEQEACYAMGTQWNWHSVCAAMIVSSSCSLMPLRLLELALIGKEIRLPDGEKRTNLRSLVGYQHERLISGGIEGIKMGGEPEHCSMAMLPFPSWVLLGWPVRSQSSITAVSWPRAFLLPLLIQSKGRFSIKKGSGKFARVSKVLSPTGKVVFEASNLELEKEKEEGMVVPEEGQSEEEKSA